MPFLFSYCVKYLKMQAAVRFSLIKNLYKVVVQSLLLVSFLTSDL